jgi:hypothetical protein
MVLIACAMSAPLGADADQGEVEARRKTYQQGREAMRTDRWSEAYRLFSQLWREQRTYDVAMNLGQVELFLQKYRDAAEHIAFGLRHLPPREKVDVARQASEGLEQAKKYIATLAISVNRSGVLLHVDGTLVGTSPIQHEVYVQPGSHTIQARGPGLEPVAEQVETQAGEDWKIEVRMPPPEVFPEAHASGQRASLSAQAVTRRPQTIDATAVFPVILTGTVAAAGLGAGIAFVIAAGGKETQREQRVSNLQATLPYPASCRPGTPDSAECAKIQALADDAQRFRTLSVVSFGLAVAAGAATYLLWPRAEGTPAAGRGWRPALTLHGSGLGCAVVGAF